MSLTAAIYAKNDQFVLYLSNYHRQMIIAEPLLPGKQRAGCQTSTYVSVPLLVNEPGNLWRVDGCVAHYWNLWHVDGVSRTLGTYGVCIGVSRTLY